MTVNSTLSKIVIFAVGAVLGSAVTYKVVETKCRKEMQEELESVREHYAEYIPENDNEDENVPTMDAPDEYYEKKSSEREVYSSVLKAAGYSDDEEEDDMDKPYVISPEQFGDEGYAEISLTYYSDGVITNERGKIVKNAMELIGVNPEEHFGEYEEDSVFVRNDKIKVDYEILRDYREFTEIS